MRVGILGTSGYTGSILLRLLLSHPDVEAVIAASSSKAGEPVWSLDPGIARSERARARLQRGSEILLAPQDVAEQRPDAVFAALPHLKSAEVCAPLFGRTVLIDLSADFRHRSAHRFLAAYGTDRPREDLQDSAAYGLVEWNRDAIRRSDIIAVPGCYPTTTLLPLLPLWSAGLIEGPAIVNALSGISGAGRKEKIDLLFDERSENTNAYLPGRAHRHLQEMEEHLELFSGSPLELSFTPHLVPLKQGMFVTTTVRLASGADPEAAGRALSARYLSEPFVQLTGQQIPQTRWVRNSNRCDIGWASSGGGSELLILFSAIDNLMKGAAGQAVQAFNCRFGLEEVRGLPEDGEF